MGRAPGAGFVVRFVVIERECIGNSCFSSRPSRSSRWAGLLFSMPGRSVVALCVLCGSAVRLFAGTTVAVLRVLRVLRGASLLGGIRLLGTLLGRLLGHCLEVAKQPNGKSVGSHAEIMGCDRKTRRGTLLSNVFFSRRYFGNGKTDSPQRLGEHRERRDL